MPAPIYQLIFDSRQVSPGEHEALKGRLQKQLGLDAATLARLFRGRPVVIRRNLSEAKAGRFSEHLRHLGAPCRIDIQAPAPKCTPMSDSLVVCPKCQHNQAPVEECSRCGLIFRKYRPGDPVPTTTEATPTDTAEPSDATPEAPEPAAVPHGKASRLLAFLNGMKARLDARFRKVRSSGSPASGGSQGHPPYLQVVLSQILKTAITASIALVVLIVGMWFARGLWMLYTATQVGETYIAEFPRKAQAIVMLLSQHTLVLPLATLLVALMVCTAVALVGQFLQLNRYFYHHRPWWWRLLLWYLPLTAAGGMVLHTIGLAPSAKLGGTLALLPTLCLAPAAFDLGQVLICEVGDLLARLRALLHGPMGLLRERIASHLNQ